MFRLNMEVFYPYPPQQVWQVITNRRALAAWLMENDFEPRIGHKFRFQHSTLPGLNGSIDCQVIELDEPKRLSYTWQDKLMQQPSIVTWILNPVDGGTRLQLEHKGLRSQVVETVKASYSRESIDLSPPWQSHQIHQTNSTIQMLEPFTINTQYQPVHTGFETSDSVILNTFINSKWNHLLNNKLQQALTTDESLALSS
ncbi:MAG: SRPBCC domain-containing protein [Heteroscytonema crispum UTEX LB 1556]